MSHAGVFRSLMFGKGLLLAYFSHFVGPWRSWAQDWSESLNLSTKTLNRKIYLSKSESLNHLFKLRNRNWRRNLSWASVYVSKEKTTSKASRYEYDATAASLFSLNNTIPVDHLHFITVFGEGLIKCSNSEIKIGFSFYQLASRWSTHASALQIILVAFSKMQL